VKGIEHAFEGISVFVRNRRRELGGYAVELLRAGFAGR
jgi:hypothetical protein